MGRKKKEAQKEVKSTTSVGYTGTIKMSVKNGNKIISTKTLKNNGCPDLFEFLANCLAGKFIIENRPCKIRLFGTTTGDKPSEPIWAGTEISTAQLQKDTVITTGENNSYNVTYSFQIPAAYIFGNSNIYKLALYPNNPIEGKDSEGKIVTNKCAQFLFTDASGNNWAPEDISSYRGNYSILIEWTLTISNKDNKD